MIYAFGMNFGSGVMDLLFHAIGQKTTLFCYFIASTIILICLLAYIDILPTLDDYENVVKIRMEKMTTEELYIYIHIHILLSSLLTQNMVVDRLEHVC